MRPVLPWRSRVVLWLIIPAICCVHLYAQVYVDPVNVTGYWTSVGSGSAIFLLFSGTMASVSAAVEGSRWRRARLSTTPNVRSAIRILTVQLAPVVALACLVQLFGFLTLARGTWGSIGRPPLILAPAFIAIILFHTALGFALGRLLPTAIGVAAALFASYAWLGFTWATSYAPLRYLAGLVISDCCSVERVLEPASPVIALGFSVACAAGLFVAAVVLPRLSRTPRATMAGAIAVALAAVSAIGLRAAADLGYTSDRPRPASAAECTGARPRICLFPEQKQGHDPTPLIRAAAANLTAAGISVPSTIRTASAASTHSTLNMIVTARMSRAELVHSFAAAFMPPTIAASCGDERDLADRMRAAGAISRWLGTKASEGIADPDTVLPVVPDGEDDARRLLELPPPMQTAWVVHNLPVLTDCSRPTTSVPGR